MVLYNEDSDTTIIDDLMKTAKVTDFTLSVFMSNLWFNSIACIILFAIFFFGCRIYR